MGLALLHKYGSPSPFHWHRRQNSGKPFGSSRIGQFPTERVHRSQCDHCHPTHPRTDRNNAILVLTSFPSSLSPSPSLTHLSPILLFHFILSWRQNLSIRQPGLKPSTILQPQPLLSAGIAGVPTRSQVPSPSNIPSLLSLFGSATVVKPK